LYSIEEYGLNEMLESVAQGKSDIGISYLSITQEREKIESGFVVCTVELYSK